LYGTPSPSNGTMCGGKLLGLRFSPFSAWSDLSHPRLFRALRVQASHELLWEWKETENRYKREPRSLSLVAAVFYILASILSREPEGPWERGVLNRAGGIWRDAADEESIGVSEARGLYFVGGVVFHPAAIRLSVGLGLTPADLVRAFNRQSWMDLRSLFPVDNERPRGQLTYGNWTEGRSRKRHSRRNGKRPVAESNLIEDLQNPLLPWPESVRVNVEFSLRVHYRTPFLTRRPRRIAQGRGMSPDHALDAQNQPPMQEWQDDCPDWDTEGMTMDDITKAILRQFTYEVIDGAPNMYNRWMPRHLLHTDAAAYTPEVFNSTDLRGLFPSVNVHFANQAAMLKAARDLFPLRDMVKRVTQSSMYIRRFASALNRIASEDVAKAYIELLIGIVANFAWLPKGTSDKMWLSTEDAHKDAMWITPAGRGYFSRPVPKARRSPRLHIVVNLQRIRGPREDAVLVGRGLRPELNGRGGVRMEQTSPPATDRDSQHSDVSSHSEHDDDQGHGQCSDRDDEHNRAAEFAAPPYLAGSIVEPVNDWGGRGHSHNRQTAERHVSNLVSATSGRRPSQTASPAARNSPSRHSPAVSRQKVAAAKYPRYSGRGKSDLHEFNNANLHLLDQNPH
jgi:hypothetical protein